MGQRWRDGDKSPSKAVKGHRGDVGWGWTQPSPFPALSALRTVEFPEVLKGYDRDEVDEYLCLAAVEADLAIAGLAEDRPVDRPTQVPPVLDALRTVMFRKTFRGYHRDQVDEYLDCAAREVDSLFGVAPLRTPTPPTVPVALPTAPPVPAAWPTVSAAPASWPTVTAPGTPARDSSRPSHPIRWTLSVIWALLPIASLGLLSTPCALYAAIRVKSRRLGVFTAVYAAFTVGAVRLESYPFDTFPSAAGATILLCMGLVATIHCFAIIREVVTRDCGPQENFRRLLS